MRDDLVLFDGWAKDLDPNTFEALEVDRRMGAMNSKQIAEWLARAGVAG